MKKKNNNGIFYVVISLLAVLAIAGSVAAYAVSQNVNVNGDYNYYEAEGQLAPPSEAINDLIGGMSTDVYYPVQFHEGIYTVVSKDVSFKASSTLNLAGNEARDVIASFYASRDMICDDVWLDIKTAGGGGTVGYGFAVGTTTKIALSQSWTTTSTATIIASSTIATTDTSKTSGMFKLSNSGLPGSYYNNLTANGLGTPTSTLFLLNAGEYLNANYRTNSATSSATWTENRGKATFHANCYPRS